MLTSINPLGERARNQSFAITATAYVVGSTLAGALLGALLGAIGAPRARRTGPRLVAIVVARRGRGLLLDAAGSACASPDRAAR